MIELNKVTKRYGDHTVVDEVTFSVAKGEIVGFLGPNGAGKSTTMNILTGYISSNSGTAKIDGVDILEDPIAVKRKIGFLPEQPPLYVDMKVKEYLNFVYDLKGCTLNRKKHIAEVLGVVDIDEVHQNRLIKNLSKGYRQRVGIAQALIGNPEVLIFDEPTVGLDPKQIIDIRNLIKRLGKNHTVILSTHILPEVQAVCDRIVIINKGKIVANERTERISELAGGPGSLIAKICGPQNEVLRAIKALPGVSSAELMAQSEPDSISVAVTAEPNVDVRKPLFNLLARNSWPLIGLEAMGVSLEDIFIRLTSGKTDKRKTKGE